MTRNLLALALTVDRHGDGRYHWVILESFDRSKIFLPLIEAATGFDTYLEALQAGYLALLNLADDVNIGPLDDDSDGFA